MKNLKSIIALLVLTVFSVNVLGEDITFDWAGSSTATSGTSDYVISNSLITLTFSKGTAQNAPRTNSEGSVRMYSGCKLVISSAGDKISKVVFTPTSDSYNATKLKFNNVALSSDSWEPATPSTSFELSASANARFKKIVVTVTPSCTAPTTPLSISASSESIALNKTAEISTTGGNDGAITYEVTPSTGKVENGVFSATATGTYKVSAHQDLTTGGVCEQDADVTITVTPIVFGDYVTECCTKWNAPTVTYTTPLAAGGIGVTPTITGTTHGEASYESSNTAVLTVDADGTIHPQGAGTAYIIVTWGESTEGDVDYCENQAVSNTITVTGNISVAFDAKGGEGTMENQSMPSGTPTKLNACDYTKIGYTFQGWDTDPAGATVVYGDEEEVTLSAGCTLYAVWKINTYTVTFTPEIDGNSITVNGDATGSVNVDYNATVIIEMTGKDSHFSPATLTYKVGEQVAVDILTDKSFNMPAGNVTLSYSFAEAAFKMISFYNNGQSVVEKKAYIGEAIGALPEQGTMTSCDETSTSFVGWTAEDISEKATNKPAMLTASTVITSESATAYNALWAEGGEATAPIEIAYWAKQTMTANTAITATRGAQSEAKLTPGVNLTTSETYTYSNNNISGTPTFVISNIDLANYADKDIAISFVGRNSQQKSFTVSASTDGDNYTEVGTTADNTKIETPYTIYGIPSSAKYIKIAGDFSTGNLYFGSIKLKALPKESYLFEALTTENTVGWTGSDWDGTYLIAHDNTENSDVLSGYAPAEKSIFTLDKGVSTLSTNDLDNAFDITYIANSGYSVQGKGLGKYLSSDYGTSGALSVSDNIAYHQSIEYNLINANGTSKLYYNVGSFKFYSSKFTEITLYKLLPTSTNYLTSCCTPLDAPTVEVSDVTTTTATLSWSSEQSANIQSYQYTADLNNWPAKGTTSSSVELKNLLPNTSYTYYVRAKSSSDDYCEFSNVGSVTFQTKPLTVEITFDAATNGGTIDGQGTKVMQYTYNGEALTLPTPDDRTGYKFNGWFTSKTGNTQVTNVGEDNKPMENKTYFAQWTQLKLYKITYNVPDCISDEAKEEYAQGTSQYEGISVYLKELPENVDDWTCIGWSTENHATATTTKPEILPTSLTDGLTGNMTIYAIYQKGESLPTGEFTLSVNYNNQEYYLCGLYSSGGYFYAKTDGTPKVFQIEEEGGSKYLYTQNEDVKTYYTFKSGSTGDVAEGKGAWTIEQNTNGTWSFKPNEKTLCFSYNSGNTPRFKYYTPSDTYLGNLTKHDIIKGQTLYTTVPCLPECELSVSGNVHLTSGKDIAVYTTTPAENVITISAPHIDRADYIQYTFLDKDGTVDPDAPFALCENTDTYAKVTNGKISTKDLTGELNRTYAISYKPSVANHIDNYTLQLKAYDDEKVELSTCTLAISGRSLPEQFVIAIKKDNKWYAVPNELEKTAGANIPAAIEVSVNNNTNPTYVIQDEKMSQIIFQAASHPTSITPWRRGAIRLQRANAESYGFITATHTDNTSFYMPDNNADDQQLYLTSSDCNKYKVTLDPALYENNAPTRWMSISDGKIGWYKTQACDVYFLPVITELIEVADKETKNLSDYGVNENTTVIVHAGGILNADKQATVGTLQIEKADGKSGQVIETETLTANNAYFDLTINASGMKWYDIAVPFTVDRLQGLSLPDGNKIPLNDVLVYDGAARATNGANGSAWQYQDNGELNPGVGYDIMFASNVTTVRFTKKADAQLNNENEELAVSKFASGSNMDANWNYIANNTLHYVNLGFEKADNSGVLAQTYNPENDSYIAYAQDKATYLIGTPFFVQVAAEDFVVWGTTPIHDVLRAPAMTMNRVDRFTLEMSANGEMTDRLFVSADENARDEYQIGKDVAKMGVSTTVAQMWINNYNTKLCANEAVLSNGQATYQLGVFVPKDGEYTIAITSAPENATLYLTIDGQVVWNLSESAYVANLTKGTHSEFGLLLVANEKETPTNINGLKGNNKAQKIFKDYNIYILRDAQMYNTQGVKVQ